jgi:hypothetical protein
MSNYIVLYISADGVQEVQGDLQDSTLAAKLTPLIYAFDRAILDITKKKRSPKTAPGAQQSQG